MFLIKRIHLVHIQGTGSQIGHIYIDLVHTHAGEALHHAAHVTVDQTYQYDDRGHSDNNSQHGQE